MREAGVYITFEESKGREPIVRNGKVFPVKAHDFDNPFLNHYYQGTTGGTTGAGTRVDTDLDHLTDRAPNIMLARSVHGVLNIPTAIWRSILPDSTGLDTILTYYTVYRATSSSTWASKANLGSTSDTFFNDTTAVPKTTYYYYVKASNAFGTSDYSPHNTGYRSDGPPSPPTNISASDGTYMDKAMVTWTASPEATSYAVCRATSTSRSATKVAIGTTTDTTYDDTTASVGKTYYYYVKASNSYGESGMSAYDRGYR